MECLVELSPVPPNLLSVPPSSFSWSLVYESATGGRTTTSDAKCSRWKRLTPTQQKAVV